MAMAYITFKGVNSGLCDGFYATQALANAAATDNTNVVAHVGILDIGTLRPNHSYFDGTNVVSDEAYELVVYNALSELNKLKLAFQAFHDALIRGSTFLETPDIKLYYPDGDREIAHDMLALCHRACRGIGLSTYWTSQQKFAWLQAMAQGPTDVPFANGPLAAAADFFEVVEEARNINSPITKPTTYFAWVHPDTAERWNLSDSQNNLNSDILDNFAAAATDFTIFRDGSWINSITV